ncbi:hypothetical protein BDY19DRAFT_901380, partial [Irpex rosettiformis]
MTPIGRAIKTAAHLPLPVYSGRGSGRSAYVPRPGELPVIILKVQIVSCVNLLAKDKGRVSDPFIVVAVLCDRFCTPALLEDCQPCLVTQGRYVRFSTLRLSRRQAQRIGTGG